MSVATPKRITIGLPAGDRGYPVDGDFLETINKRTGKVCSTYLILSSRRINTRDGSRKYALGVVNVDAVGTDAKVWWMRWHTRTRRRPR